MSALQPLARTTIDASSVVAAAGPEEASAEVDLGGMEEPVEAEEHASANL